ncbi:MAG: hypothetical protein ORN58_04335 [Sediminibacterium sp.]|nr:hypothetical protein [Sediminibacterium sp.]
MKRLILFLLLFSVISLFSQTSDSLISINNPIFKNGDTLKLRSLRAAKIQLRTINNLTTQELSAISRMEVSGSNDSLFCFIIPSHLLKGIYKMRGINANDTSRNTFLIRIYNLSLDSTGYTYWGGSSSLPTDSLVQISVGPGILGLKADGTVVGSGNNEGGQTTIPAGLNNVVQVAAGYRHSLALKSDGTVVAWGNNEDRQTTIPAGLNNVVQIAAGAYHNVVLKSDGTVVSWGDNYFRQINTPANLTNVVQVSAGYTQSLALKADSTAVGWGGEDPDYGYVSNGLTNIPSNQNNNIVQVAAGGEISAFLKADDSVFTLNFIQKISLIQLF